MHSIMASLNLGQDAVNKRERKKTAAPIVAKSYSLQLALKMCRYGSLLSSTPLVPSMLIITKKLHTFCFLVLLFLVISFLLKLYSKFSSALIFDTST